GTYPHLRAFPLGEPVVHKITGGRWLVRNDRGAQHRRSENGTTAVSGACERDGRGIRLFLPYVSVQLEDVVSRMPDRLDHAQANRLTRGCREDRCLRLGRGGSAGEYVRESVVQHITEVHVLGAERIANSVNGRERGLGCIAFAEPVRFSAVVEARRPSVFRVLFMSEDLYRMAAGVAHIHVV